MPHGPLTLAKRGRTLLVGDCKELEPEATDTDRWALFNGYIAVTPTQLDVTAKELIDVLKEVL